MRRRRLALTLGGGALLGLLATGLAVGLAILSAQSDLERHARFLEQGPASLVRRDFRRPVVLGDPVEGNAWDLYLPAILKLEKLLSGEDSPRKYAYHKHVKALLGLADPERELPDSEPALLSLGWADAALRELREGARRTRVDPGFGLRQTYNRYDQQVISAGTQLDFVAYLISWDHREGRDGRALETVAVLLAVAQDLGRGGSLAGASARFDGEVAVLEAARRLFEEWSLTAEDLKRFAERLDGLDRIRESLQEVWPLEDLLHRDTLLSESRFRSGTGESVVRPGWRCLFSERVLRAQALNVCEAGYRRMSEASLLPPDEAFRAVQRLEAELRDHPNPLVGSYLNFNSQAARLWTAPGQQRYEVTTLSHRSLLRLAVALARYECEQGKAAPSLDALVPGYLHRLPVCSLSGQPFRYAPGRIWSVGINGVDDGGVASNPKLGLWHAWPGDDKDIVWKVRRKSP